ncbi:MULTISPECIES: hypothetical protein [unclassified Xanthomonas]|uniref:hypothetical protein n=1 Tax=unclassified Xanthomonas TaxID=2643310 RepID=UPI000CEF4ED3|nr:MULTISPECIES: hypothetical protein [unclassified Xanthomonas]PPU32176.1 hypothetical protein XspCFBP7912_13495 [Xanthomonas sp. CFBP 7912]RJS05840.1 hypothetical protein XnspCFBP7698_06680 [Xanthomonas sp. CFBP 7698]
MTSKMRSAFMLDDPVRHSLITAHRFYVQQAKDRLLSKFGNISAEADAAADAHWEESGRNFNPDIHDEGKQAEDAQNHGIIFYELLSEMHERTRLSVVAGMFHHWDKAWRRFLVDQLRLPGFVIGIHTRRAMWTMDSIQLERFLEALGLSIATFPGYARLDAMRLVVNVFKHGEGRSMDDLRLAYPEFVPVVNGWVRAFPDDTSMKVTDTHLDEFANAIESFWKSVPKELVFDATASLKLPKELAAARAKDLA